MADRGRIEDVAGNVVKGGVVKCLRLKNFPLKKELKMTSCTFESLLMQIILKKTYLIASLCHKNVFKFESIIFSKCAF